jgi:hypothetical protein
MTLKALQKKMAMLMAPGQPVELCLYSFVPPPPASQEDVTDSKFIEIECFCKNYLFRILYRLLFNLNDAISLQAQKCNYNSNARLLKTHFLRIFLFFRWMEGFFIVVIVV